MKTKTIALTLALLPALAGARDLRAGTFELGAGTELSFAKTTIDTGLVIEDDGVDVDQSAWGVSLGFAIFFGGR